MRTLGAVLAALLLAAACGGDDGEADGNGGGGSTAPEAQGQGPAVTTSVGTSVATTVDTSVDPDGVLRIGTDLTRGFNLDPALGVGSLIQLIHLIHGMPLQMLPDGTIAPYLAESYEVTSPTSLVLELRSGLTFHNGQPYDAATLRTRLLEYQASDLPAFNFVVLNAIADIALDSPTQLTFTTSTPVAGLLPHLLSTPIGAVAVPGDDPNLPAGAGPFRATAYRQGEFVEAERWDGFFRADDFELKGVEWLSIPAVDAQQNALRAGQVDLIASVPSLADGLVGSGSYAKIVTNNEAHFIITACKAAAPFDDPRFRRAFFLGIDRDALNTAILGDDAVPMEGLWPAGTEYARPGDVPSSGDPDAARQLLAEIGWDPSTVVPIAMFAVPTHQRLLEVIQGQLDEVGIKVELRQIPPGGDPTKEITPSTGGGWLVANVNAGIEKVARTTVDAGAFNACHHSDPEIAALVADIASGRLTGEQLDEAWEEIQDKVVEEDLVYPLLTQPTVWVYDTERVQGLREGTVGLVGSSIPSPFLEGVSIIAK